MAFLKKLNFKDFSRVEFITMVAAIISMIGIGVYIFDVTGGSKASSYTYDYLGKSVQNPIVAASSYSTASLTILQTSEDELATDQSAVAEDQSLLTLQEKIVQSDQEAVNVASKAFANAKVAYASGPNAGNPNILERVNSDRTILAHKNDILKSDLAAETTLVTAYKNDQAKVVADQANVVKYSASGQSAYTNSTFYSYACQSPGAISGTVNVYVAMVTPSYVPEMQSGAYSPHAAAWLNSNQIIDLGSAWNYDGTLATGSSQDQAGAWMTADNALDNLPAGDSIALGPLPDTSYSAAWTSPVKVSSLSNCSPAATTSSNQSATTGTVVANNSTVSQVVAVAPKIFNGSSTQALTNAIYFDNTYWYWPETTQGLTGMDANITPVSDGSPDGYLFANQFYFSKASDSFTGYLGLETVGQGSSGKTAKFTIWGSLSSSGPGYNTFGSQGDKTYYSSEIKYNWLINHTYDLKLELTNKSAFINTWTASVIDTSTKVSSIIGSITTPAQIGMLDTKSATFHERYSTGSSCSNIHQSAVKFSDITANNGSVGSIFHATLPPSSSGCTGQYETENMPQGLINIMW